MCIDSDCTKARIPQINPKQDWEKYILKGRSFCVTFCSLRSWFPKKDEVLRVERGRRWMDHRSLRPRGISKVCLLLLPEKKECASP